MPVQRTAAVLILAVLGRRWRFRLEAGQALETDAGITIRPRHGIRMRVERRAGSR
jgi:cytochrome P450